MAARLLITFMVPRVCRISAWFSAAVLLVSCYPLASASASAISGYSFRGVQAPQVKPIPLAAELLQSLSQLRAQLRDRSVRSDLTGAIEQSLLHNPQLAESYSRIQQAQWELVAVRRQWYPTLNAAAGGPAGGLWGYGTTSSRVSEASDTLALQRDVTINQQRVSPILNLGWTFFDLSRGSDINAAGESLRSQELLFNVAARNLVLQTQLAYFNLQEQEQLIASYEENLSATTSQVNEIEALFNAGNASIADVEQIRTQQYQTLSLLISTYLSLIDASASLAKLMALPPGQLVLPKDRLDLYGQWNLPLDATIQQAQSLREEIQSSLAQASSAGWRANALLQSYWPRLSLGAIGSYGYNELANNTLDRQTSSSSSITTRTSSWDGAVGLGFSWMIFDGGISAARSQSARALERQYKDTSEVQRLVITQEVEQAYASYETGRLTLLSSRQQVESARKAFTAIRERFNIGYADTTSVIQTLDQAIRAANAFARAQRQYNEAVAGLYRASAQWPDNTVALRDQRIDELRKR